MKKCNNCNQVKPLNQFWKNRTRIDGVNYWCAECDKIRKASYRKSKEGVISEIYNSQKQHSKRRKHIPPEYTKQEFSDFCFASPDFHKLYDKWVISGHERMTKPSFDRADDSKGYTFDNFNKWMTWLENSIKGNKSRTNSSNTPVVVAA